MKVVSRLSLVAVVAMVVSSSAFVPEIRSLSSRPVTTSSKTAVQIKILEGFSEILENFDDVVDDFMNKRMGNGEVFYGKRKFKPSNKPNTEGNYDGMGMSDKNRIDIAREYKAEIMRQRQERQENRNK